MSRFEGYYPAWVWHYGTIANIQNVPHAVLDMVTKYLQGKPLLMLRQTCLMMYEVSMRAIKQKARILFPELDEVDLIGAYIMIVCSPNQQIEGRTYLVNRYSIPNTWVTKFKNYGDRKFMIFDRREIILAGIKKHKSVHNLKKRIIDNFQREKNKKERAEHLEKEKFARQEYARQTLEANGFLPIENHTQNFLRNYGTTYYEWIEKGDLNDAQKVLQEVLNILRMNSVKCLKAEYWKQLVGLLTPKGIFMIGQNNSKYDFVAVAEMRKKADEENEKSKKRSREEEEAENTNKKIKTVETRKILLSKMMHDLGYKSIFEGDYKESIFYKKMGQYSRNILDTWVNGASLCKDDNFIAESFINVFTRIVNSIKEHRPELLPMVLI